jgi:hypothetical protein
MGSHRSTFYGLVPTRCALTLLGSVCGLTCLCHHRQPRGHPNSMACALHMHVQQRWILEQAKALPLYYCCQLLSDCVPCVFVGCTAAAAGSVAAQHQQRATGAACSTGDRRWQSHRICKRGRHCQQWQHLLYSFHRHSPSKGQGWLL